MALPFGGNLFPPGSRPIVSYDYFDISNGAGYDVYYGANISGGYITTTVPIIGSSNIKTVSGGTNLGNTDYRAIFQDLDFDIQFNLPRNIKGAILVNVPLGAFGANEAQHVFMFAEVEVFHVVNGAEVSLGSNKSPALAGADNIGQQTEDLVSHDVLCKINVAKLEHFKKGDILRFRVNGWFQTSNGGLDGMMCLAHDPAGRPDRPEVYSNEDGDLVMGNKMISDTDSTQLSFHVPFVIDV